MGNFSVEHKNPDGLFKSPVFSQAITVSGRSKTIYIGGQNAVNRQGEIVGKDDLALQTKQILENIQVILSSEGASLKDLIKMNIYMVQGCDPRAGLGAFREVMGDLKNPPIITVLFVAGLANPNFLIEIDGIAVVEDKD
jgi:enamine deaminase RidA (YjgF/YER057c/UK114 family)